MEQILFALVALLVMSTAVPIEHGDAAMSYDEAEDLETAEITIIGVLLWGLKKFIRRPDKTFKKVKYALESMNEEEEDGGGGDVDYSANYDYDNDFQFQ